MLIYIGILTVFWSIDYTKNSGLAQVVVVWPIDMCFHSAQSLQWLLCMQ